MLYNYSNFEKKIGNMRFLSECMYRTGCDKKIKPKLNLMTAHLLPILLTRQLLFSNTSYCNTHNASVLSYLVKVFILFFFSWNQGKKERKKCKKCKKRKKYEIIILLLTVIKHSDFFCFQSTVLFSLISIPHL